MHEPFLKLIWGELEITKKDNGEDKIGEGTTKTCGSTELWKQKKGVEWLEQKIIESRRSRGEFHVKSDEKVTEMLINEIQKKC